MKYLSLFIIAILSLSSCRVETNDNDIELSRPNFLDLFYGMERDSDLNYSFRDSILDNTSGLVGRNFYDTIYNNDDNSKARISLGIYIDERFPNSKIQSRIEEAIDTAIYSELSFWGDKFAMTFSDSITYPYKGTDDMFAEWNKHFDRLVSTMQNQRPSNEYKELASEARVAAVAHKIYEDSDWATYIVETSVDYYGSCGCPSSADYFSVNKRNGDILTLDDILKQYDSSNIGDLLIAEYQKKSGQCCYTSTEMLQRVNGVAYTTFGLLFYFHPYNIGSGAEGQYNLIIKQYLN